MTLVSTPPTQQAEGEPVAVGRPAEDHGRDAEQHEQVGERIGEGEEHHDQVALARGGQRPDGEEPDGGAAARDHHRGVDAEFPALQPVPARQREGQQGADQKHRVGQVEQVRPGHRRVLLEADEIPGRDAVADEDRGGAGGEQPERSLHCRIEHRRARGQAVQDHDTEIERHERQVAHEVADLGAAESASLPGQIADGVDRRQKGDRAQRNPDVTSRHSPWRSAILCSRVVGRKCGKNNGLALDMARSSGRMQQEGQ